MKKKLISTAIICFMIVLGAHAQECNAALFLKKGSVLEYTSFTKKGREDGKTIHETIAVSEDGSKFIADIKSTVIDKKGEEAMTMEY